LSKDGTLQYLDADFEYQEFPMMKQMALSHYLERHWIIIEDKILRSHQVSEALVMEMARMSKEHNVGFMIAAIAKDGHMLEFVDQQGILNVDISVDLNTSGNKNLPHDPHPSAAANKLYAAKLEAAITTALSIDVGLK
jgi:hypothetical protein